MDHIMSMEDHEESKALSTQLTNLGMVINSHEILLPYEYRLYYLIENLFYYNLF